MRKLDTAKRWIAVCNDINIIDLFDRCDAALCLYRYLNHLFSDKQLLHKLKHKDSCHSFINPSLCYLSLFTAVVV